jgi:DNA-binding response OmpR family regulator
MRVLLVSTVERERERYAEAFRQEGYCTLQAATAADACRLAVELLPAAVVADVQLSICHDGVPLVRRLRQECGLKYVPVVILAGSRSRVDDALAQAGADLFVTAPGDPRGLVAKVASLVGGPVPTSTNQTAIHAPNH